MTKLKFQAASPKEIENTEAAIREAEAQLKAGKATLAYGAWTKGTRRGEFEAGGSRIVFSRTTDYKVIGRLRQPGKTKYQVYVYIYPGGASRVISKTFAVATGESQESNEKVEVGTAKAQAWAQQVMGLELGKYDFAY